MRKYSSITSTLLVSRDLITRAAQEISILDEFITVGIIQHH